MNWIKTWNVPEYKEWALKTDYGYLLLIIKKEKDCFRCAKAKLIFKENSLPEFILIEEKLLRTIISAKNQIKKWK